MVSCKKSILGRKNPSELHVVYGHSDNVPLLNGATYDEALDDDLLLLTNTVYSIIRLRFGGEIPGQVKAIAISAEEIACARLLYSLDHPIRGYEVEAHTATLDAS